jgi:hypothetical protein
MLAHPRKQKAGQTSGLVHETVARLFAAVATTTTAAITPIAAAAVTATTTATATVATAAAATTPAAAEATPVTAAAVTAATTRRALLTRTRDIDRQGAAVHLVTVELFHGLLGLLAVRHRDECETAGTTGELVEDDFDDTDGANLAEEGLEVLGGAGEGEVPHVELVVV